MGKRNRGPATPRLPCRNCQLRADDHKSGKCPFASTKYESIEPENTRRWFQRTFDLLRGDIRYERVFFDNGWAFTWESDLGEDAGIWTNVGQYRGPAEQEELQEYERRKDGIAYLKGERGPLGLAVKLKPFL